MGRFLDNIQKLFLGEGDHDVITYETMQSYGLFKWENFVNGIKVLKVYDDGDNLVFITHIPKGKKFGIHKHNCLERCFIVEGWLDDKLTKEQKIGGQVMTYPAHIAHEPLAKEDTILTVSFKRPLREPLNYVK